MPVKLEDVTRWGFFKKYRVMLQEAIDHMAEYEERSSIHRRLDIPRNHYYNVTNEFRTNPAKDSKKEHPYHIPFEYLTKVTVGMPDECPDKYMMIKEWGKDLGCTVLTPAEKEEIRDLMKESAPDPLKVLSVLQKLAE